MTTYRALLLTVFCATLAIAGVSCSGSDAVAPEKAPTSAAVPAEDMRARYEKANALLPWKLDGLVDNIASDFEWSSDGRTLHYAVASKGETEFVEVDAATGEKKPAAAPVVEGYPSSYNVSADGRWAMRVNNGDLILVSLEDGAETVIADGESRDYGYGLLPDSDLYSVTRARAGETWAAVGLWSPDSTMFLTYRMDQRRVRTLPLIQSIAPGEEHQIPVMHQPHVALPGDKELTTAEFVIAKIDGSAPVDINVTPGMLADWGPPPATNWRWRADSSKAYVKTEERGFRAYQYYEVEPTTGDARVLIEERSTTTPLRDPSVESGPGDHTVWPLNESNEFILYSERDGYGHYYLYDGETGALKNRITGGDWIVHDIEYIDEAARLVYFLAGMREEGREPYFSHLYRAPLDGGAVELLTPDNADHRVSFSPGGDVFVDQYSTVDMAPVTVLRAADGSLIAKLETGDLTRLKAYGWRAPERFEALAADGVTKIYGTIYEPADLDPSQTYPVLEGVYMGGFNVTAGYNFQTYDNFFGPATSALGFVVVVIDGRGTGMRGQAMQDFSYGANFGRPEIMEDHVVAIRQLAEKRPYLDLDRVGIFGHSWGGYRAARAMFQFPDFYKVGAASSGSHDNFLYSHAHERWFGMPDDPVDPYRDQSNLPLADRLKGKLLLLHGEVDDSVHPANTIQMADALIRANKDFDLLLMPNMNHNLREHPYFIRYRWDYLVRHLKGVEPPREFPLEGPQ